MSSLQLLYLTFIFLAVAGGVFGLGSLLLRPRLAADRLLGVEGDSSQQMMQQWQAKVVKLAKPLAKLIQPEEGVEHSRLRSRFIHAGFRRWTAMPLFFAAKVALALLLPVLLVIYFGFVGIEQNVDIVLAWVFIAAGVGFFLPNLYLNHVIRRRQRHLFEAFPDAIDLLVVCMEAGLGLDAAIARASEEMRLRSPALADELYLVILELRVGASREQALRNLAARTGLDDVSSLVTLLIHADRFGTNIADALRVHADSLRSHRHMLAEEAAAKVAVKLVFPVVLCIFPALMIVLGGPPFLSILRNLFPAMGV